MDGYELVQAGTTSITGGQITIHAIARAVATCDHEATGQNRDASMQAFRQPVPDGWQVQYARTVD
ncbi:MAG: hypothetical protein AAGC90_13960 [Curtobacterium sp.]|uniref:hypothetical protein n=1 Tax=Curtobacterium sp. Curtsp57 TaxID=3243047 RepID=UPI0031B44BD8